mgnify:FL=1
MDIGKYWNKCVQDNILSTKEVLMNCFMCKGDLENKNTTFMVELNNCIIIIKNVPSQVCKQCGEVSYSNEVAKQLERLVNSVKNTITEITVINYTEKVA